jgi:hypothetical protein
VLKGISRSGKSSGRSLFADADYESVLVQLMPKQCQTRPSLEGNHRDVTP